MKRIRRMLLRIIGRLVGSSCLRCGVRCGWDLCQDCQAARDEELILDD